MRAPRLALAFVLMVGLAACGRSERDSGPGGVTNKELIEAGDADVAKVCASDETLDGLKALVLNGADAAKMTPAANPADRTELATGGRLVLESPILSSFDKTTRKVTCSAKVSFVWPPDVTDRLKAANPARTWIVPALDGQYTIQPQADDRALVYSLDAAIQAKTVVAVVQVLKTLARAEIAANAPPPPPPPSASVNAAAAAAASDTSIDPGATGDTSVKSASPPPQ